MVLKLRPVVTMAGIDHICFGQQDGRVVKAPSFRGERTKYTPDMRRFKSCCQKRPYAGRMVLKLRPVVTMTGRDHILGLKDGRVVKAPSF